jgi:hypothetical protein
MMNKHVLPLADLVETGTEVRVVKRYDPDTPAPAVQMDKPEKTSSQSDETTVVDKKG